MADLYQIEKDAKLAWEKTPSIRSEFGRFETYLSYKKAEAENKIKVLSSGNTIKGSIAPFKSNSISTTIGKGK